ncbi:phosphoheptose isomerase [bacterium]|nr:phosphoheptose isomerase [bacterium]
MEITADLSGKNQDQAGIFKQIAQDIERAGYSLTLTDDEYDRPWGGFFFLDEAQIDTFASAFFPSHLEDLREQVKQGLKLTPKILVLKPGTRLSWQYHHLRSELWYIITGSPGLVVNDTDELPTTVTTKQAGDTIVLTQGTRHRLVGSDDWAVWAEIWMHTDPQHPSSEHGDIVRLVDSYGRKSEIEKRADVTN